MKQEVAAYGRFTRMNERTPKVPQSLTADSQTQSFLKLKGLSVIESCTLTVNKQGSMYLEDHLLLVVNRGNYMIRYGEQQFTVRPGQMVLLHKAIAVQYEKFGDPDDMLLEYMMFFLKDDLLTDYMKTANLSPLRPHAHVPVSILPVTERLKKYVDSLRPYFSEPERIESELVRLKLLELLFDVADADSDFLCQILQLKRRSDTSIAAVMEENWMNPVSINDLAYLSGRSVSSFKREFQTMYNTPPSQWIRERRLDKAKELLAKSSMSVTDVCFTTGFENVAHFSKTFKKHFGFPPSSIRQQSV